MKKILSILLAIMASVSAVAADFTLQTLAQPQLAISSISHPQPTAVAAGARLTVSVAPRAGFRLVCWKEGNDVLSTETSFDFTMPERNVMLTAVMQYQPDAPANPNPNCYYADTKTAVMDDFLPGSLLTAFKAVSGSLKDGDVSKLIVRGIINKNDVSDGAVWLKPVAVDLANTAGITRLQDLGRNANLATLHLPDGIEQIDATAFRNTPNVSRLTLMTYVPPTTTAALTTYLKPQQVMAIYVPQTSLALYQEHEVWGQYTILPITADVVTVSVALPAAAEPDRFQGCHLSLVNVKTGQRLSYVMDGRQQYRFSNILKNSQWRIEMTKDRQLVGQKRDVVDVQSDNVETTIDQLTVLHDVTARVLTPDGTDIAAETTVLFLDENEGFLGKGTMLSAIPEGMVVKTRVRLTAAQQALYQLPDVQQVSVGSASTIVTQLAPWNFRQQPVQVQSQQGEPLHGARVFVSQRLASGLADRSATVFTAADGLAQLQVAAEAPFSVTVSADGYVNRTLSFEPDELAGTTPVVALKKADGTVIDVQAMLHFTPSGQHSSQSAAATSEQLQSVSYEIFDLTQQRAITEFGNQGNRLQLYETLPVGHVLQVSATLSPAVLKTATATAQCTVGAQTSLSLDLYELGALHADLTTEASGRFMALLFDENGHFVQTANYQADHTLDVRQLSAGQYQLVTMPTSRWLSTVASVDRLQELGFRQDIDYVLKVVTVEQAQESTVAVTYAKTDGASLLPQFFAQGTSFEANKQELTVGNYVTLSTLFVPDVVGTLTNLQLVVDLPEGCDFVEGSALVGGTLAAYVLDGRQLTISLPDLQSRVRFCVVPVEPGDYQPSALLRCTHVLPSGEQHRYLLPIGATSFQAKSIAFYAPRRVAMAQAYTYGVGPALQTVEVREDDQVLGRTQVGPDGKWKLLVDLDGERDYFLHAEIIDEREPGQPRVLKSQTRCTNYDRDNLVWNSIAIGDGRDAWENKNINRDVRTHMPVIPRPNYIYYPEPVASPGYIPVPVTGPVQKYVTLKFPRKKKQLKRQTLMGVIVITGFPPSWPPSCWPPFTIGRTPPIEGEVGVNPPKEKWPPDDEPDTIRTQGNHGDDTITVVIPVKPDTVTRKQWENIDIYYYTSEDTERFDSAFMDSLRRYPPEPGSGGCLVRMEAIIDPAGYVYEAVSRNRVEGVTTTAYYKEQYEDQYGDVHERTAFWDAWNYGQQNPLYTDREGVYQWDVPQGQWQVKYEKTGCSR